MVVVLEVEVRGKQVLDLRLVHVRCNGVLESAQVVDAGGDIHVLEREGRLDRVLDELEERWLRRI